MTTQQMQYILEVYQTKSMSRAAQRLYTAQSNLSNSIRALENELGYPIFKRSKYGVLPTDKGLLVLQTARRMWDDYERLRQLNAGVTSKRLHLGGTACSFIQRSFERLCLQYQNDEHVELAYDEPLLFDAERFLLSDYDLQVGLVLPGDVPALAKRAERKGVLLTAVQNLPIVLRIGAHHPLYHKENVQPSDCACYTLVDYAGNIYQDYPMLDKIVPINRKRTVLVGDRTMKHRLVANSNFISLGVLLPEDINEFYHFRNIPLPGMAYTIAVMERMDQRRSPVLQQYLDLLEDELETARNE